MSHFSRYSHPAFLRMLPHLTTILSNYPNPTLFSSIRGMTAETFKNRLREALIAFSRNPNWPAPFTLENVTSTFKFFNSGGEFIFSHSDSSETVYCGPRQPRLSNVDAGVQSFDLTTGLRDVSSEELDGEDEELVRAVCVCKMRGVIKSPITFAGMALNTNVIEVEYPGVFVEECGDGKYLML